MSSAPPTASLARSERSALADLLEELGPDAPTIDEGWTTAHLAAHVVARDRRPDAALGLGAEALPVGAPLAAYAHRVEDRLRTSTPFAEVVRRLRSGPPAWFPTAWRPVDRLLNTAEMAIHHEDVRRAQPGWEPRPLPRSAQDELWGLIRFFGRMPAGRFDGGLRYRRSDVVGVEHTAGGASPATTVTGEPLELLLWASGRDGAARVTVG